MELIGIALYNFLIMFLGVVYFAFVYIAGGWMLKHWAYMWQRGKIEAEKERKRT